MLAGSNNILCPGCLRTANELQIGDEIVDHTGNIVRITDIVAKYIKDPVIVAFADRRTIRVSKDEVLNTLGRNRKERILQPHTPIEILNYKSRYKFGYDFHLPPLKIMSPEQILPIDPYLLGVLLGDGCLNRKTPLLSTDKEIIESLRDVIPEDCELRYSSKPPVNTCHWASICCVERGMTSAIRQHIKLLNLEDTTAINKFVPSIYKFGSYDQRLSLIQGLMDTDGYAPLPGGSVVYTTISEQLMSDFVYLIRSVGGMIRYWSVTPLQLKQWNGCPSLNTVYRASIRMQYPRDLFRLTRKKKRVDYDNQYSNKFNIRVGSIIPTMISEMCYGFVLSNSESLIVTDAFIGLRQYPKENINA